MKIDKNTVIFITGGGSGFGLDSAQRFYTLGAKVVLADIQLTKEAEFFIKNADSSRLLVFSKFDVTDEESIQKSISVVVEKFKGIDILLNSAGVATFGQTINKDGQLISNDDVWRMIKINLVGTVNVSKYVAQQMIETRPTSQDKLIINVSSIAGIDGGRGILAYAISKGGVIGITLPMARDLGKYNIRVVTLAPQFFYTPMGHQMPEKVLNQMAKATALERLGYTKEFTDTVISVVDSAYVTGSVIRLDGGIRSPHL